MMYRFLFPLVFGLLFSGTPALSQSREALDDAWHRAELYCGFGEAEFISTPDVVRESYSDGNALYLNSYDSHLVDMERLYDGYRDYVIADRDGFFSTVNQHTERYDRLNQVGDYVDLACNELKQVWSNGQYASFHHSGVSFAGYIHPISKQTGYVWSLEDSRTVVLEDLFLNDSWPQAFETLRGALIIGIAVLNSSDDPPLRELFLEIPQSYWEAELNQPAAQLQSFSILASQDSQGAGGIMIHFDYAQTGNEYFIDEHPVFHVTIPTYVFFDYLRDEWQEVFVQEAPVTDIQFFRPWLVEQ